MRTSKCPVSVDCGVHGETSRGLDLDYLNEVCPFRKKRLVKQRLFYLEGGLGIAKVA